MSPRFQTVDRIGLEKRSLPRWYPGAALADVTEVVNMVARDMTTMAVSDRLQADWGCEHMVDMRALVVGVGGCWCRDRI